MFNRAAKCLWEWILVHCQLSKQGLCETVRNGETLSNPGGWATVKIKIVRLLDAEREILLGVGKKLQGQSQ